MPADREKKVLTEKELREYAERAVPAAEDPWPAIRQRLQTELRPEPERASASGPERGWPPQLVPSTPLGYALAVLSVLILAVGAYAASGPVRELSRQGLLGGPEPGHGEGSGVEEQPNPGEQGHERQGVPDQWAEDLLRWNTPEVREANLDVRLNETRTVGRITVALERAYADEGNVVIVYSTSGWDNQEGHSGLAMPTLSDESGATFESVGNSGMVTDPMRESIVGKDATIEVLEPSEKLEASGRHEFRLRTQLDPSYGTSDGQGNGATEAAKTLTFDFAIPVHELDVIDVGQTVEANEISMTLDRVENSPARSQAILCFDPPQDEKYIWLPLTKRPIINDFFLNESLHRTEPEEPTGCVGYDLYSSLYDNPGAHSITVTKIEGRTRAYTKPEETISGPWTFEFETPEP
jgi:hypothetical protein